MNLYEVVKHLNEEELDIEKKIKEAELEIDGELTSRKKVIIVRDPKNKRTSTAKDFSDKHGGRFQIGNSSSGSTPTVFLDSYELRFKDLQAKSGNAGHAYENFMVAELKAKNIENREIKELLKIIDADIVDIVEVEQLGGKNTPRPIDWSFPGGRLVTKGYDNPEKIGSMLADISIKVEREDRIETVYISNKTSDKITFINAGLGSPGSDNEKMKKIIEWWGAPVVEVIAGFEDYDKTAPGKDKPKPFVPKQSAENIEAFLASAIGLGYIYMHPEHVFEMNQEMRNHLTSNPRNFEIIMPSKVRKRLDIKFETDGMKSVLVNMRSKTGKLWPSHLMCDYKLR